MNSLQKQPEFTPDIIESFLNDDQIRVSTARESHLWFFHTYFAEYVRYPTAEFQKEIFRLRENDLQRFIVITAFRGSAKSTIATMSFPLWAIMGRLQKRYLANSATSEKSFTEY
jgi:hypothetical protein